MWVILNCKPVLLANAQHKLFLLYWNFAKPREHVKRYLQSTLVCFLYLCLSYAQQGLDTQQMLAHLEELSSDAYEGRGVGEEGNARAREYIIREFGKAGLSAFREGYTHPFGFLNKLRKPFNGINVVGYVRGTLYPGQYIVVSAHYDHLGVRNDVIYNGADDNGSGTCALLVMADYFGKNPPIHSIIFAAFDAEEQGLQGARNFVEELPVDRSAILLNINMDMIGRNTNNELYACGTYHYRFLKKPVRKLRGSTPLKISFGHDKPKGKLMDWTSSSDHGPFHKVGIPFLYFGVEDHPDYHKPTDDFKGIMPAFYGQTAAFVRLVIERLDKSHTLLTRP